jgi:hypothetical protein
MGAIKRIAESAVAVTEVDNPISYGGHRFPPEVISYQLVYNWLRVSPSVRPCQQDESFAASQGTSHVKSRLGQSTAIGAKTRNQLFASSPTKQPVVGRAST